MININPFCVSSFLAFRYIVFPGAKWVDNIGPCYPKVSDEDQVAVGSADEIIATLQKIIQQIPDISKTGIFLSGGIDSAILASFLPRGTKAYTINFAAVSAAREAEFAKKYADAYHLDHHVVDVTWQDYLDFEKGLMQNKKAPLHAVEVALHKAAIQAKADGIDYILVGNGADSTFGGMDKLLSRDWSFDDFVERYTFVSPEDVVVRPVDVRKVFEPYRCGDDIDYIGFLKRVHGLGIIQAFNNGVQTANVSLVEPFEKMKLKGNLDISRIRAGEPKYLLMEVFRRLYPGLEPPYKVPFVRPMGEWLADYKGPTSSIFRSDLQISNFAGDQKYLIYGLDKFLGMLERGELCP